MKNKNSFPNFKILLILLFSFVLTNTIYAQRRGVGVGGRGVGVTSPAAKAVVVSNNTTATPVAATTTTTAPVAKAAVVTPGVGAPGVGATPGVGVGAPGPGASPGVGVGADVGVGGGTPGRH